MMKDLRVDYGKKKGTGFRFIISYLILYIEIFHISNVQKIKDVIIWDIVL